MEQEHLTQGALADRWNISPRTLERWRWLGQGPQYLKVGGQVRYRLADVEAYERNQLRASTADGGARVQSSLAGAA
ncbi:helix-turn-helix domain-containing protein [Amaricoccus sp.]|uniref:helix-turn-helix transcriptional regulator n=1 Tax=Amaricoccus sp. TaxID=1872485 RepID=UPI001B5FBC24|nr:helix-turn-helix domain-containing protein [Amaricoccus sp.]MBP7003519.1 helix-turn-helix domain-containing protein [Amaricoccus sp.]